jgi:hypothetical protein
MALDTEEIKILVGDKDGAKGKEEMPEHKVEKQELDDKGKEEAVSEPAKRIHSLFPILAETAANPEIAYSDHLPQLAYIPLTAKPNGPTLKVLSLNTLGRQLSCSGIHKDRGFEEDDEITRRYTRIVESLNLIKDDHGLDSILLQEVEVSIMLPLLEKGLGINWNFQISDHGLITCHNKATLTPINNKALFDRDNRVLSNSFKHKETGKTIVLHNSWGIFSHLPSAREDQYKALLAPSADDNGNVVRIIMGDTNSRIAPLDNMARNIVTGAIPLIFYKAQGYPSEQQLGDYPDGGFYTDSKGRIIQIETFTLDFATGNIIPAEKERESISWVNEPRMIMRLDYRYKDILEPIGGQTLFEYEDELKERSGDVNIQVYMTATSMNDKGIAICFSNRSPLYKALESKKEELPNARFVTIRSDQCIPTIFLPAKCILVLIAAIETHLPPAETADIIPLVEKIETQTQRLRTSPGPFLFNRPPNEKIEILEELKKTLSDENDEKRMTKYDVRSTIRRWENQEHAVVRSGVETTKTNADLLGEHRNIFSERFKKENEKATAAGLLTSLKSGPK